MNKPGERKSLRIGDLLKPHARALTLGAIAAIGESVANLLQPWPLKLVLDNVLKSQPAHGWLNQLVLSIAGADKFAVLKFACAAVLANAAIHALCSYAEKKLTTRVGQ